MATFNDKERDVILAALRLWQVPGILDHVGRRYNDLQNIVSNFDDHEEASGAEIDALCERLNCEEGEVELSECCHAEIGYDAWVDSNGALNGGPYDNSICTNCSMEDPEVWDGESLPWPRDKREGNADLPEGVEEPEVAHG